MASITSLVCHTDSFCKTYNTFVVSVDEISQLLEEWELEKSNKKYYALTLNNTILFPGGGGQPTDKGFLQLEDISLKVLAMYEKAQRVYHIVEAVSSISVGDPVTVHLYWPTRFDHMQQHSGQHLISDILENQGIDTLSWSLGKDLCSIEIPKSLTDTEVEQLVDQVNTQIREDHKTKICIKNENDTPIRYVAFGSLTSNKCCGTHVNSTGQLGSVMISHQITKGRTTRLFFAFGLRVGVQASKNIKVLRQVANGLYCAPDTVVMDRLTILQTECKENGTMAELYLRELADTLAKEILSSQENIVRRVYHRPEKFGLKFALAVESTISSIMKKQWPPNLTIVFITGLGQKKNPGGVLIRGQTYAECVIIIKGIFGEDNIVGGTPKNDRYQGRIMAETKGWWNKVVSALEAKQ